MQIHPGPNILMKVDKLIIILCLRKKAFKKSIEKEKTVQEIF